MNELMGKIHEGKEELFHLPQDAPTVVRFDNKDGAARVAIEVTVNVVPASPPPEYLEKLVQQMIEAIRAPMDGTITLAGEIGPMEISEAQHRASILDAGGDPDAIELGE